MTVAGSDLEVSASGQDLVALEAVVDRHAERPQAGAIQQGVDATERVAAGGPRADQAAPPRGAVDEVFLQAVPAAAVAGELLPQGPTTRKRERINSYRRFHFDRAELLGGAVMLILPSGRVGAVVRPR